MLGPARADELNIVTTAIANPKDFDEIRRESITRGTLPIAARILRAVIEGELPEDN